MMIMVLADRLCEGVPHELQSREGIAPVPCEGRGKSVPGFVLMLLVGALFSFVKEGFRFGM